MTVPPPVFTLRMVRELKGAPLSCLILLIASSNPVSNDWLCMMSGYTDKPVAQALRLLSSPEYQLVKKARGGWVLAKDFQAALGSESRNFSVPAAAVNIDSLSINDSESVVAGRNFSDSDSDPVFFANLEACREVGIGEPSASLISGLDHVTAEYIRNHAKGLKRGEGIGLAILRMRNNEVAPEVNTEESGDVVRYSGGQYAEYLDAGAAA